MERKFFTAPRPKQKRLAIREIGSPNPKLLDSVPLKAIFLAHYIPALEHKTNPWKHTRPESFLAFFIISLYDNFDPSYFEFWGIERSKWWFEWHTYKANYKHLERIRIGKKFYYRLKPEKKAEMQAIYQRFEDSWNSIDKYGKTGKTY